MIDWVKSLMYLIYGGEPDQEITDQEAKKFFWIMLLGSIFFGSVWVVLSYY